MLASTSVLSPSRASVPPCSSLLTGSIEEGKIEWGRCAVVVGLEVGDEARERRDIGGDRGRPEMEEGDGEG
jgi:hypothetical protein